MNLSSARALKIDPTRLKLAFEQLRMQTAVGNDSFRERFRNFAIEHEINDVGQCLSGLSQSNIKNMRRTDRYPESLPGPVVSFLFSELGVDITELQSLEAFHQLGFDIQLRIDLETKNLESNDTDAHNLKNLSFEIHEAKAVIEDPGADDTELDLRIGFDRARLTIRAKGLRPVGNKLTGETPAVPGEPTSTDYTGWFNMRLASRTPLSWYFDPVEEGKVLEGRVDADTLGQIETSRNASVTAEISVKRDALKVRIVSVNEGRKASKSLAEQHRDKMCAAVARKSFANQVDEFLIFRLPMLPENVTQFSNFNGERDASRNR